MDKNLDATKGQAIYSSLVLKVYDLWVLGISNSFIWRCKSSTILSFLNKHFSPNHLDVGVGTGYYINKCDFKNLDRLGLMDMNQNCLNASAHLLNRFSPVFYIQNVLEPIQGTIASFDSISINYLLHCLPGTMSDKGIVFDNLNKILNPRGIIFGSTILTGGVPRNAAARKLMAIYNKKGIFSNEEDSLRELNEELSKRYSKFSVVTEGCVALFWAQK